MAALVDRFRRGRVIGTGHGARERLADPVRHFPDLGLAG
jgi:tRNA(Arg) A34 adenosine deaminase TadA